MNNQIRTEEVDKLARIMNDAIDVASLEAGLLKPQDIRPFQQQSPEVQRVIRNAARFVYESLVFDKIVGEIRVFKESER